MIINKITKTRKYIKGGSRNGYIPHIKRKFSKFINFVTPKNKRMKQILAFAKKKDIEKQTKLSEYLLMQKNLNSRAETTKPLEGYERLHALAKEAELQKILNQEKRNYSRIQGIPRPPVNRNSKRLSLGQNVINRLKQEGLNFPNSNSVI